MGKEKKQFNIGDLVFAKVKGYPAWPAKITKYNNKKYSVYFYGTGETANIKVEDLFQYAESKEKFATDKNLKRSNFREAIEQIEAALNGEDSAPIDLPEAAVAADELLDDGIDGFADVTADDSQIQENVAQEIIEKDADSSAANIDESLPNKPKEEKQVPVVTSTTDSAELVSRSGRKIKTKRYIDEVHEGPNLSHSPPAKKKVPAEGVGADTKKSAKKSSSSSKPTATITPTVKNSAGSKSEIYNNLLLAFVPPAKCVGIKLDYGKPETFATPAERIKWEEKSRKEAGDLKEKLEIGQIKLDAVKDRVIVNPPRSKIHQDAANRFTNQMIEQEDALFVERDFIQMSQQLRESLGLKSADVNRCVELLKQYKDFELTQLMLLRNPDCVDIIRRLRRYVGNLKEWSMGAEEETEFRTKAEIIRNEAIVIYNYFKKIFKISSDQQFWEPFCDQVKTYKECTKHISEQNRITMSEKTYMSILANFKKDGKHAQDKESESKSDDKKENINQDNQADANEKTNTSDTETDRAEMDESIVNTESNILEAVES
ncbi:hepatoma-derived growth factor-related protein 2 [Bactrocera neohumeralis]|uniref:hepatoma-derived growth factor-related protein 2 n=1 Tax=Bactrocera tryoni TaxID=59916 RepID=UPI001A95BF9D|nr:hepatoma-derived growth factor-related protein 2 [Bactrocera tryoni]XP_050339002.1 hepatoma-derived growth factor-related protein 2 [Bactrocera neohumeralis]